MNFDFLKKEKRYSSDFSKSCVNIGILESSKKMLFENNILSSIQGHGFAAEKLNHFYDRIFLKNPQLVGMNNLKNGADRIVQGEYIQTKFCRTPWETISAAFDNNGYRYEGMKLEVPKDQYKECLELFEKRIINGEVPGAKPGDSYKIIHESYVDYSIAKDVAEFGNIKGIMYDAVNGMVSATLMTGLGGIIIYSLHYWESGSHKSALDNMFSAMPKIFFISLTSNVIAGQVARTTLPNLAIDFLSQTFTEETSRRIVGASVSSIALLTAYTAYDFYKVINGNLHINTLVRNIGKNTCSIGGATIGASISDDFFESIIFGIAGGVIGSLIGNAVFGYSKTDIKEKLDLLGRDIESYLISESGLVFKEWDLIDYSEIENYIKTEEALSFLMEQRSVLLDKIVNLLKPQIKSIKKSRETIDFEIIQDKYIEKTKLLYQNTKEEYEIILDDAREFQNYLLENFG